MELPRGTRGRYYLGHHCEDLQQVTMAAQPSHARVLAWMGEDCLTLLTEKTDICMVLIARERIDKPFSSHSGIRSLGWQTRRRILPPLCTTDNKYRGPMTQSREGAGVVYK
ncbi:hypothetical protein J6590_104548 [Homalodisca vitripennis]|nr:hypothetical protein J6590_104548 [Homalodisca vitripennis]